MSAIRYPAGRRQETSGAFNARWRLAPLLARLGLSGVYADLQGEYAQRDVALDRFFSLDRSLGRALYLTATLASGSWGLSLEYKDYQDFALEHINNPPPLIREHSAYLLNRITHDVLADDEQGYQAELSYALPSGQTLTANATRATRRGDQAQPTTTPCANFSWRWSRPWGNAPMCSFLPTSATTRFSSTTKAASWARAGRGRQTRFIPSSSTPSSKTLIGDSATSRFLTPITTMP